MRMKQPAQQTAHYQTYPRGHFPVILAYGFRPFFLLAPAYLILSVLLWGAIWTGWLTLGFTENLLEWHIYELLFGVTSAMMIGFILTAVPELVDKATPIVGKPLLFLVALWVLGRISFWLMDWLGIFWVALTNIALLSTVVAWVAKPILSDPLRRQHTLLLMFCLVIVTQAAFFLSKLGWVLMDSLAVLKFAVGVFMMLVLVAVRLINMRGINEWMKQKGIDDVFYTRAPYYNIAIVTVFIYTVVELITPNNPILTWLAFAAMAAILSTINDFFNTDTHIVTKPFIWPLLMILSLLATGYGLMGLSALLEEFTNINHFRHILTMGALGMAYFVVLITVVHIHTGRELKENNWIGFGALLIILATALRAGLTPFFPEYANSFYGLSAILWALPYLGFLIIFHKWLLSPRADGLKG